MIVRTMIWICSLMIGFSAMAAPTAEICVLVGAPGEEQFTAGFTAAAHAWEKAAERGGATFTALGLETETGCSNGWRSVMEKRVHRCGSSTSVTVRSMDARPG